MIHLSSFKVARNKSLCDCPVYFDVAKPMYSDFEITSSVGVLCQESPFLRSAKSIYVVNRFNSAHIADEIDAFTSFYLFPYLCHSITSSATLRAFSDACSSIGSKADSNPRSAMP